MTPTNDVDTNAVAAAARAALDACTPGKWSLWPKDNYDKFSIVADEDYNREIVTVNTQSALSFINKADIQIILNAPDWLRALLDHIDTLNAEIEQLKTQGNS